jgi:DNA-directed RNA polymerase specialized sigma24 family protein
VAAKNLGIPINTLKTRVHRARKIVLTLREQSKRVGE